MAGNAGPQSVQQTMGTSNTVFITEIKFDPSYLKTPSGIMKAIVIILGLLGGTCIQISPPFWTNSRWIYFNIVAHLGLWFSVFMMAMNVFRLLEKHHNIKWLKFEMRMCTVLTVLYFIASTKVVTYGLPSYSAAGFFGYLAMVLYGFDAFLKHKALKAGELAQGHCDTTNQTDAVTPAPPALP